jgi:hypothetical protein
MYQWSGFDRQQSVEAMSVEGKANDLEEPKQMAPALPENHKSVFSVRLILQKCMIQGLDFRPIFCLSALYQCVIFMDLVACVLPL